jgi:hypothetical protein
MAEASELWDNPDSGLKEGPFDGVIYKAEFAQGQSGRWSLQLEILADDEDVVKVALGVGNDWASYDGGETIQGPSSRKKFSDRSGMWRWISAANQAGAVGELKRRDVEDFHGKGPLTAAIWHGLKFTFDQVKEPGDRPNAEGVWVAVEGGIPAIRPVKFIPETENTEVPKAAKPAKSAKPTSTASNGANGLSEDQEQHLVDIAQIASNYNDFSERVMEGVHGWDAGVKREVFLKMADESWYEGLKAKA